MNKDFSAANISHKADERYGATINGLIHTISNQVNTLSMTGKFSLELNDIDNYYMNPLKKWFESKGFVVSYRKWSYFRIEWSDVCIIK
jgi:hypothetical protein